MNGARMRSNSLAGTFPANTKRSVPRLSAPWSARTRTSRAPGSAAGSSRISPRPGAPYHSAAAACPRLLATFPPVIHLAIRRPAISCPSQKRIRDRGMLERTSSATIGAVDPGVTARRAIVAALNAATMAALLWLAAVALSPGGYGFLDCVLIGLFAVTLPWTVVGFWNAVIGLIIMRLARDPVAFVFPAAARVTGAEAIASSTAILVCIRNEMREGVLRTPEPMLRGLVEAGVAERFHVYLLSDTSEPAIAAAEEKGFGA